MASFTANENVASTPSAETVASLPANDGVVAVAPAVVAVAPADAASVIPADTVASCPTGTTAEDGCAAPVTQIMLSGGSHAMSCTLRDICDTFLGGSRPQRLEATVHSVNSKYTEGDLTPAQLAAFHCRMYEAMSNYHDNGNALVAWISSQERTQDHWRKLGHISYDDYLKAIDPSNKVRTMLALHEQTTRRKKGSEATVQRCWAGFPELLELVSRTECESRWRAVAALARATENAPDVAKFCLNKSILERVKHNKDGRRATKAFLVPDFIEAKKMAESIDRATCPWDAETYSGVSQYKLKVYRGVLMSTENHRGLVDPPRAARINVDLPGDSPPPAPPFAPASSAAPDTHDTPPPTLENLTPGTRETSASHQLTTENLAAITVASPPLIPAPPPSSSGLSSVPLDFCTRNLSPSGTPPRQGGVTLPPTPPTLPPSLLPSGTPPREGDGTLPPAPPGPPSLPPSGTPPREAGVTLPPTPYSPARRRQTGGEEDGTPSPRGATINLGLTERAQPPMASIAELLAELSGGSERQWTKSQEMSLQGGLDWLLRGDPEVVKMLRAERDMYDHHQKPELCDIRMSLASQAARQDPGLYALAVACLGTGNPRLVTSPCKGEGAIVAEVLLDDPVGNLRIAAQLSSPTGQRLTVEWSAMSDDGKRALGNATSSWGRYMLMSQEEGVRGTTVQLRTVNALGAALLCRLSWDHPSVLRCCSILLGKDRDAARAFIQTSRQSILGQLKIAYRDLERTEKFWYGKKKSFFAARKRPADNTHDANQPDKRARLSQW